MQATPLPSDFKTTTESFNRVRDIPLQDVLRQYLLTGDNESSTQLFMRLECAMKPEEIEKVTAEIDSKAIASADFEARKFFLLGLTDFIKAKAFPELNSRFLLSARDYFKKAAAISNEPFPLLFLGKTFDFAMENTNVEEKNKHYHRAIDHPHLAIQFTVLGIMYQHGYGYPTDLPKAIECYQTAADLGDPQGALNHTILKEQCLKEEIKNSKLSLPLQNLYRKVLGLPPLRLTRQQKIGLFAGGAALVAVAATAGVIAYSKRK